MSMWEHGTWQAEMMMQIVTLLDTHRRDLFSPQKPMIIKTHGCVLVAKKDVWHTSVLFTGTAKSLFSTPHISITTGPLNLHILCPTLHTKFEENQISSLRDMRF